MKVQFLYITSIPHKCFYCLQIVKCLDPNCCTPFRSNWLKFVSGRFIKPLKFIKHFESTDKGVGHFIVDPDKVLTSEGKYPNFFLNEKISIGINDKRINFDTWNPAVL